MGNDGVFNATIRTTFLGIEDHGMFSYCITMRLGGSSFQGFGQYRLDLPGGIGTRYGCESIQRIIETVGVDQWENLRGKNVRVRRKDGLLCAIGHIVEDKWFCPADLAAECAVEPR